MKLFFSRYRLTIYLFLALLFLIFSLFLSRWSDQMLAQAGAIYYFGRHFKKTVLFSTISVIMLLLSLSSAMTGLFGLNDFHALISKLFTLFGGNFI